jgi:hypothetical protein
MLVITCIYINQEKNEKYTINLALESSNLSV